MHVLSRALRVFVPVLVVAVIVAAIVSVLSARPDLDHAKRNVDASWTTLAPQLDHRFALLAAAADQSTDIPGPVHELADDVTAALARWKSVNGHASLESQVGAANALEALGRRLLTTAAASPRVATDQGAKVALSAYLADRSFATARDFNQTVAAYERERRGPIRRVVARVLGDASIPAVDTTGPVST